jgi:hypothetical protein
MARRQKKDRPRRRGLEIDTVEQLVAHRELAYIRNPSTDRLCRLEAAKRAQARQQAD